MPTPAQANTWESREEERARRENEELADIKRHRILVEKEQARANDLYEENVRIHEDGVANDKVYTGRLMEHYRVCEEHMNANKEITLRQADALERIARALALLSTKT